MALNGQTDVLAENGNAVRPAAAPFTPEVVSIGVQQSFVSDLFANIKWVAIGAVAGYAACWFMGRKRRPR